MDQCYEEQTKQRLYLPKGYFGQPAAYAKHALLMRDVSDVVYVHLVCFWRDGILKLAGNLFVNAYNIT